MILILKKFLEIISNSLINKLKPMQMIIYLMKEFNLNDNILYSANKSLLIDFGFVYHINLL